MERAGLPPTEIYQEAFISTGQKEVMYKNKKRFFKKYWEKWVDEGKPGFIQHIE